MKDRQRHGSMVWKYTMGQRAACLPLLEKVRAKSRLSLRESMKYLSRLTQIVVKVAEYSFRWHAATSPESKFLVLPKIMPCPKS